MFSATTVELALVGFFLLCGLMLAGLAVYVRRNQSVRGADWLTALLGLTAVWGFSAAVKLLAPTGIERVLVAAELPIGVAFALVFFGFASSYTGRSYHRRRTFAVTVTVACASTLVLVATNPFHHLFWRDIALSTAGFPHLVHVGKGPLYYGFVLAAYVLYCVGVSFLVDIHLRSRYGTRSVLLVTLGGACPLLVNLVSLVDAVPIPGLDYTPFGLALFGLATTQSIQQNLLRIVPIARDTAVEQSSEGIVILDAERRVRDYNPAATRFLPALDDRTGDPFTEIFDGELRLDDDGERRSTHAVGAGSRRHVSVTTAPVTDGPYHLGWTVVISDITEQKRRERHLKLVGRFLRHNMSNRMTTIRGLAQVLYSHVDDDGRDYLETIDENVDRIVDTNRKLREIQKIVTDDSDRSPLEVTGPVERIAGEFDADYPDAQVTTDCPDAAWASVSRGFRPAVRNLVENGIEHDDTGDPRVTIAVTVQDDHVRVAVVDDGPGIPATDQRILEEGESQLRHSSGVGLWLVYTFVDHSEGDLAIRTPGGGGTEVSFTLDRAPPYRA